MEMAGIIISASVTIFALGLFIVSVLSYKKFKNLKLLFISGVFFVLLVKGILFSLSFFYPGLPLIPVLLSGTYSGVFDLIILIILFLATLKR